MHFLSFGPGASLPGPPTPLTVKKRRPAPRFPPGPSRVMIPDMSVTQEFTSEHLLDDEGRPAGGETYLDLGVPGKEGHWRILYVKWQDGPLQDPKTGERSEPNGLFVETLIAAAADRLRFYEDSGFSCAENREAIAHLDGALEVLQARTARREAAGVEGSHALAAGDDRYGDGAAPFAPPSGALQLQFPTPTPTPVHEED